MAHIKFDGIIPREELTRSVWGKFVQDTRIFGKNLSYFETCSKELQCETIEWFFSELWFEIQDLSVSEGRSWKSAVSIYLKQLCRQISSAETVIRPRRKYQGADKWRELVGLIESQGETQLEGVEARGVTCSNNGV